jgi:anaerobic ribonucleoside-triphosphate reductase
MGGKHHTTDWKALVGVSGTSGSNREDFPVKRIVKRDGRVVRYDRYRIESAIAKAVEAVRPDSPPEHSAHISVEVTNQVEDVLREFMKDRHPNSVPAVEEIQDLVETALIGYGDAELVKAYIIYRSRHESIRDTKALMLDVDQTMDGYLSQADWRVNENANVNFSLGGLILHNSGTITANYWLRNIYSEGVAEAHKSGAMHIHDLSMFSGYCAGWSIRQLISEGLGGVSEKITSKPAAHLSTLVFQIVNFLGIMQNEWAGAQALASFDTYLAPFVRADGLSFKEVKQCIQSFIFGVNTPSRWGSQAPFTNITMDWTVPVRPGRSKRLLWVESELEFTYGDCKPEMDLINRAFIELMLEGDASGRGFAYPIPTYNITKDFDWESDNSRLLFEMTAKYGHPIFRILLIPIWIPVMYVPCAAGFSWTKGNSEKEGAVCLVPMSSPAAWEWLPLICPV